MVPPIDPVPVTLEGRHVRLEPLALRHLDGLCAVGLDAELWRWTGAEVATPADMRDYVATALAWQAQGSALPFALVVPATGQVVGSTRYANIDRVNRRLEIGWTWVARTAQRTPVNTEAKYLLLRHAFEGLGCIRVEFKTDVLNERSRRALLRIGAREEGVLRSHMITATGRVRDSVYFSILVAEWPEVKAGLVEQLARPV
jgi:RimJ/RimL family protein N-acetyltransferase